MIDSFFQVLWEASKKFFVMWPSDLLAHFFFKICALATQSLSDIFIWYSIKELFGKIYALLRVERLLVAHLFARKVLKIFRWTKRTFDFYWALINSTVRSCTAELFSIDTLLFILTRLVDFVIIVKRLWWKVYFYINFFNHFTSIIALCRLLFIKT